MLVLKRKKGESIQIGEDITITVLAVEGEQVKIGIEAPRHIDVHRQEVYVALCEENEQARQSANLIHTLFG